MERGVFYLVEIGLGQQCLEEQRGVCHAIATEFHRGRVVQARAHKAIPPVDVD